MKKTGNLATVIDNEQTKIEEYEELLVKRDQLFKEAGSIMTSYTQEFGDMITANFELKVECIKKKKTISYCRRRMNRGLSIDANRMNAEIDKEMNLYYVQLKDMIRDNEAAKKSVSVGEFRFNRAKKVYRRLAKQIHPDINKKTNENDTLKELWTRIVTAYNRSDVEELDDLEVLVRLALNELGGEGIELDYTDIDDRIERIERQINDILTTEPYTFRELLEDEEKTADYKLRLQEEHRDYEQYLQILTKTLDDMLREGGVTMLWKMD